MIVLSDASFANEVVMKSQLGFVILLADGHKVTNTVHYCSTRCHRVSQSVMDSELHALVHAFDNGFVV